MNKADIAKGGGEVNSSGTMLGENMANTEIKNAKKYRKDTNGLFQWVSWPTNDNWAADTPYYNNVFSVTWFDSAP